MKSRLFIAALAAAAGSANAQWADNFNRPDGPIGGDWTQTSGTWAIIANQGAHTSAAVNTILTHNTASIPYAISTSTLDVFRPTGTTGSTLVAFLIGLGGTDTIQVKVQSQGASPDYNFLGIYHRTSATAWGPWTGGLPFQALTAPFNSARLTVTFPDANTLRLDVDTNFDGIVDQTYTSGNVTSIAAGLGTGHGIGGWTANTSSFDNWAVAPIGVVGACCLPSSLSCSITTQASCTTQGGVYNGDNSTCATANCPSPGACCLMDGTCVQATPAACTAQQGVYRGNSTPCATANCPQPTPGACCLPDGTCASITGPACLAQNGLFGGAGSACATADCAKAYPATIATPIPIPDGLGSTECGTEVFAEVNVPDSFTIGGIEASYHILHTFQGDVTISLEKVGGPTVVMVDRPGFPPAFGFGTDNYGASAANAGRFISNDTAANIYDAPATAGVNNPVGRWKSENAMAPFVGLNSQGMWRLKAKDCAGADTGSIVAFTLLLKGPSAASCYANCDNSTIAPCLNVNDFTCFLNAYGANLAYANCDQSTIAPVLNVNDFTCFLNTYGAGCGANNCSPRP